MVDYVSIDAAREAKGLRLVLTRMPGAPWSEAAKAIFEVKKISYLPVAQLTGATDEALRAWTGFVNAPIALYNDERPRAGWLEILLLAERLSAVPALIPSAPRERALMLGLAGELMSEDGLIWNRRQLMFSGAAGSALEGFAALRGAAYGYGPEAVERAPARIIEVLKLFSQQLAQQRETGSRFLFGTGLTALDIYWACACAIVAPLSAELAPMPEVVRASYEQYPDEVKAALDPALVAHRDFIYRDYLTLPIDA